MNEGRRKRRGISSNTYEELGGKNEGKKKEKKSHKQ